MDHGWGGTLSKSNGIARLIRAYRPESARPYVFPVSDREVVHSQSRSAVLPVNLHGSQASLRRPGAVGPPGSRSTGQSVEPPAATNVNGPPSPKGRCRNCSTCSSRSTAIRETCDRYRWRDLGVRGQYPGEAGPTRADSKRTRRALLLLVKVGTDGPFRGCRRR